jgi:acetyl esterase/lipase
MKMIHMQCPGHPEATLEGYILDCAVALGQEICRPAIVVCPGGGYVYCSDAEAEPVALSYTACGFHAFILRYSTGTDAAGFAPLEEVSWVIGYLREHAEEWNIDPNKIVTCGFSAGGHLAFSAGLLAQNKPNAVILNYPVCSAPNMPGMDFMLKFLTGKEKPTDEDAAKYDLIAHITQDAPPLFIAATAEDLLTTYGALPAAQKYTALGKPFELHIFQHGPHGYSLATAASANGSTRNLNDAYAQWQPLSVKWLNKIFGEPVFIDKNTGRMGKILRDMGINLPGF